MKEKVKIFLDSDTLEKYLLGDTTKEETLKAERYITMYPEVRETYNELQDNLETFAKMYARKTPEGLKEIIVTSARKEKMVRRRFYRYAVAASVAIMLFAGSSVFFWNQNKSLQQENTLVTNKIKYLEDNMKNQLEDMRNQFIVLNNPDTKKYAVNGKREGKELKAIAYINPVKKLSYINVSNVPNLPENKCFQMWAEVNGELVNLGVIKQFDEKDKLLALPYADKAVSYITVEPKGGNTSPSVENIVANINY
ncbi:RNA polymerase subunit sigma-70 [Flagellimonas olearia]|uniref:RNA polymerase subunit sigma-70 n=1 Tax=Flagellimonas olearia TaxID=552546 RepID=A0A444VHI4_9FLAO|nr:anti-sigma factor [Allomuricauda olearia]KAB7529494.1 RNA polymerase subunit sigma-70 [Allomuricauda olearia]RYC50225.1 RNA polymerase subunit sigma-70 [Allomuricauda olearia]